LITLIRSQIEIRDGLNEGDDVVARAGALFARGRSSATSRGCKQEAPPPQPSPQAGEGAQFLRGWTVEYDW
jgi:hypothetical protein